MKGSTETDMMGISNNGINKYKATLALVYYMTSYKILHTNTSFSATT